MTFRGLTFLLNISTFPTMQTTERGGGSPPCISQHSIQTPISSAQSHCELHEGSGLYLSFLNNALFRGGTPERVKVVQSSEQHLTPSSQYGSLDKSYAYSNTARVVNAVAVHTSGCWIKCQPCCSAKEGRIFFSWSSRTPERGEACVNSQIVLFFACDFAGPLNTWRNEFGLELVVSVSLKRQNQLILVEMSQTAA